MGNTNSIPVPNLRPSASPGVTSPPWRVLGTLTASDGGSAAAATPVVRLGGQAEQPKTWLEGEQLQGGNRSPPPTPDCRIRSPASPKGFCSRGLARKRGMERVERERRGGQAAAQEERGLGRRAPGGGGKGPRGGD